MKKKSLIAIIAVALLVFIVIIIKATLDKKSSNETEELSVIEGCVLEVGKNSILINETGCENGECYLLVNDSTEVYIGNDKSDVSSIEIGKTVTVVYSGGIEESYPGKINDVIKITVDLYKTAIPASKSVGAAINLLISANPAVGWGLGSLSIISSLSGYSPFEQAVQQAYYSGKGVVIRERIF